MPKRKPEPLSQQPTWHNPDGTSTGMFHGMGLGSTDTEPPADIDSHDPSLELPIRRFRVELVLSSDTEEEPSQRLLSIAGLTSEEGNGIFQAASAQLLGIVSRVRSTGDSHRE
jgi:hypothetical protein